MNLVPDLSICLINRSGWMPLRMALQSFYDYYGHVSLEFFVVELGGKSGLAEKLGQYFPEVHLFEDPDSMNNAAAWNMAARLARGRYLAFWDENLVCKADCLPSLIGFMDDTPDAGAVGPSVLSPAGRAEPSCYRFPSVWRILKSSLLGRDWREIRHLHEHTVQEVDWLSCEAFILRRETLEDIGFFDEGYIDFFIGLDWCRRAAKKGWHVHFLPTARAQRLEGHENYGDVLGQMRSLGRFFWQKNSLLRALFFQNNEELGKKGILGQPPPR